jgi:hypothetical protein
VARGYRRPRARRVTPGDQHSPAVAFGLCGDGVAGWSR